MRVEEKRHDAHEGYVGDCDARSTGAKNAALVGGGDFVEVKHGGRGGLEHYAIAHEFGKVCVDDAVALLDGIVAREDEWLGTRNRCKCHVCAVPTACALDLGVLIFPIDILRGA